jgi:hypothetical protein
MIYKKSDKSIIGFMAEDNTGFVENDTHNISTNKVDWTDPLKTFEEVSDTINTTHEIDTVGKCVLK